VNAHLTAVRGEVASQGLPLGVRGWSRC
jgi:hypothetical protein